MSKRVFFPVKRLVWIFVIIVGFIGFCWIYPFLWMLSASFKTTLEIFQKKLNLIPARISFENYWRAWVKGGFSIYFMNSVITTVFSILIVVFRCALAGYVLAKYNFPGKTFFLSVLIITFLIPLGTTIIPTVQLSQRLGLLNTRTGLILAMSGGGATASVLLYKGYFEKLPGSLSEAAVIDGAGFFTIFSRVMFPMTGPVTATVTILTFMGSWNNFMLPLVFTFGVPSLRTLPVGMMAFQSANETDWSGMASAGIMALVPIVACFIGLQKYFVSGIAGAVKG
jgi:raffinose/stachyose/melibiose transport system permease protein